MKICKYGLSLTRLKKEDAKFVFEKIRSGDIKPLVSKDEETSEEQIQEWFYSITNLENIYYLVEYHEQKIGILITKNISWEKRTFEIESNFWDETIQNSGIPLMASLILLETIFYFLNWNTSFAKASRDNKTLISQLHKLGYTLAEGHQNAVDQLYCLTAEGFETNMPKLKEDIKSLIENKTSEDYLLLEPIDYESGIAQVIENNFLESGVYLHRRGISGSRMYFR